MAEIHTIKKEFDPRTLIFPLILLLVILGTIWGIVNYFNNKKETFTPTIELTSPVDGETYDTENITVQGKTNSKDMTVKVNGREAEVGKDKTFSVQVPVNEGANSVGIIAETDSGKRAEKTVTIYRRSTVAVNDSIPSGGADLSSSGPETLWIPEATMLAMAGAGYYGSKKRLKATIARK